jgi:8-oxo-dGTP diphosphatase
LQPSFQVFAAAVIVNESKQILLGKTTYQRIHPWGVLGGGLKLGEDPEQGVIREMLEETGLKVKVKKLLMAKNSRARDQIGLFYWCEIHAGEFCPSDEISEIAYFDVDHLPMSILQTLHC